MNQDIIDSLIRLAINDQAQGDARMAAIYALGDLNATTVAPTLASYVESKLSNPLKLFLDKQSGYVTVMIRVLSGLGYNAGAGVMLSALSRDVDHHIHIAAAEALGFFRYEPAIAPLARWIAHGYGNNHGSEALAIYAACESSLVQIGARSLKALLLFLNAPDCEVDGPHRTRIISTIVKVMKSDDNLSTET